jgi:paraquat-inducible protein B
MLARPLPEELVELRAGQLGSLSVGSPVTYRQVPVGEVVGYDLDPGGGSVLVRLQVRSPYHQLIRTDTRFWDAGGVDTRFDAGGLHLHVGSMAHLLLGGVAFENPAGSDPGPAQGHVFTLYPDREQAFRTPLLDRHYFLLRFQESVHGLAKGAPVEFRGLPVGQVEDFPLAPGPDPAQELARGVPVLVSLDPERLALASGPALERTLDRLVRRGLRAQLRPGSLVTGGLYVDLGFFPGAGRMARERDHWVLPTMPSTLTALADHLTTLLQRLQSLPLEDIAARLRDVLPALRATLDQAQALSARLDRDTAPRLEAALDQVRATLAALQRGLDPDAPVPGGLRDALDQLTRAARALRDLADSLEQHPESLVFGKGRTP